MSPGENTRDFYREQGRREEQERIIQLLEADAQRYGGPYCSLPLDLIALIKGEN